MATNFKPVIADEQQLPELTFKVLVLGILLAAVLAIANTYLALKIGILTSASIPAAIISMGILSFFKDANILENNLVQTCASAGEAVAGGIVYTVPALIIIHYWVRFSYWENLLIALIGGVLGVMFSIPLRRVLVSAPNLKFPEGRAIAEILKARSQEAIGFTHLIFGGLVGGGIELAQTGFKVLANSWEVWFVAHRALIGFGGGFSAAMIGAGYLIGVSLCLSIFIGAILGWFVSVPLVSELYPHFTNGEPAQQVMALWGEKIRYIGIGAMLSAGLWTLCHLARPLMKSLKLAIQAMRAGVFESLMLKRTDRDLPMSYVLFGILMSMMILFIYFLHYWPFVSMQLGGQMAFILFCVGYIIVIGAISCALTAYFSGMVGVSATPGSSIIIGSMLFAAVLLYGLLKFFDPQLSAAHILAAEVTTILIGAFITSAAAISNDNMQDLKVGYLLGATPWKQQLMLLLGVVVAAFVIPYIMQLLYDVYGIAGVMPRAGMDASQSLPAPPAALMAAISQAVFHQGLPWDMMSFGLGIIVLLILVNRFVLPTRFELSVLGVAIGIYLPLASSIPICLGGFIAWLANQPKQKVGARPGTLIACGLVAGAALMDVVLAIPFSIWHSPDALRLVDGQWQLMGLGLSVVVTLGLALWFYKAGRE